MSQLIVNAVHRAAREFAARLRVSLGPHAELVDKCGADFADDVHRTTCERLGLNPDSANNAHHPWARRGFAKKR